MLLASFSVNAARQKIILLGNGASIVLERLRRFKDDCKIDQESRQVEGTVTPF